MDSSPSRPGVPKSIYIFFVIGLIAFVWIESGFFESVHALHNSYASLFKTLRSGQAVELKREQHRPTDFAQAGTLRFTRAPNPTIDEAVFEYLGANNATTSIPVKFDQGTICVIDNWGLPCAAMSMTHDVAFGGKRATVEGVRDGDYIRMQKLHVYGPDEPITPPLPGMVYVNWSDMEAALKSCRRVKAVFDNTPERMVRITFWDSPETWEAWQPLRGSLMTVLDEAKQLKCPVFPEVLK